MLDRSWMENPDNSICQDCGGEVWAFMVHDAIWLQAGYQPKGFACRACLAKRLGRPLVNDDFQNVPINWHNVPGFMTEERMAQLMDGFFQTRFSSNPPPVLTPRSKERPMNIADIEPYDISKEFVQLEFRMRVSAPFDMHTEDVVGDRFMQLVQADILLGEEEKKVGEAELYWLRKGEIEDRGGDIFEVADSIDADPFSMVEDLFDPDTLDLKDKIMDAYGPDFVLMGADVVLLQRLFIEPEYRGYGIGTQAVRTIKNYFATWCGLIALKPIPYDKDTGFRRDDRKGRNRLIKFYERFGFRRLAGEHMLLCTEVAQQPPVKETKPRPRAKKV